MDMNTKTIINLKIDKTLKNQAAELAAEMGFNLSSVITSILRNFVTTRELHVSSKHKMTKYLESVIEEVNAEKESDKSPAFKNSKDAMNWINSIKK